MKKDNVKIGMIGFGGRGTGLLKDVVLTMDDVHVLAVCDLYEDRREEAAKLVNEKKGNQPKIFDNYKDVIAMDEIDAVIITTSWADHIHVAIEAMENGKDVAFEVGGAYSIDQCWQLVRAQERTGKRCMMLENCCYGRDEMMVLNMVKKGIFGEIVHCQGGYRHDLRNEIAFGKENRHYRLVNYSNRNGENYPTHELGPIAKILNINRGNRMLTLTSTASCAKGLHSYIQNEKSEDSELLNRTFTQGDVVTTVIKCAHGETITLYLDTTLPRSYSRGFHVQGTKGMFMEDNRSIFIDGKHNEYDFDWKPMWNNIEEYRKEYDHPLWNWFMNDGVRGGHGGMDYLVFRGFFESILNDTNTPIDVYDSAAWMAVTCLSEQSVAMGGMPVAIPDFTDGKWVDRRDHHDSKYGLEIVNEELFK